MIILINYSRCNYLCFNNNQEQHRIDGPANDFKNGCKFWFKNGRISRENGPAAEYYDGAKFFYLDGKFYVEKEYWAILKFKSYL